MFNEFLKSCFKQSTPILPSVIITIDGVSISAVYANEGVYGDNQLGGLELDNGMSLTVNTDDLPSDMKNRTHETLTVDGQPWRISKILHGQVITTIDLVHEDKT